MRFSQRKGLTPVRIDLQRDEIDEPLRNKLWSALHIAVFNAGSAYLEQQGNNGDLLVKRLWIHHFQRPVDTAPAYGVADLAETIRPWFFSSQWFEVYDFIEAVVGDLQGLPKHTLTELTNSFLENENSAYRLASDKVVEITSEDEVRSIESALHDAELLAGVREHLRDALAKLSDRKVPDYRNSIKESISAVEALCQAITGDSSATLGKAIKRLSESGVSIHPSLEQAWTKLYGYTSDEGGIRHALSDEPKITYADAKYMLVSCSAFVSYLIETARSTGVTFQSPQQFRRRPNESL